MSLSSCVIPRHASNWISAWHLGQAAKGTLAFLGQDFFAFLERFFPSTD
jgi:hypothetical protein